MSSTSSELDLSQFYQIFFEEAGENLDTMEQILLNLDLATADDEQLNAIFRCAHSVKGGAATFGFADVAELTHRMESLLDKLRRHEIAPDSRMVDVLLESADAARALLARQQAGGAGQAPQTQDLLQRIEVLAGISPPNAASVRALPSAAPAPAPLAPPVPRGPLAGAPPSPVARDLLITLGPLQGPERADPVILLFRDIQGLGSIEELPTLQAQTRRFKVLTPSSDADLVALLMMYLDASQIAIQDQEAATKPLQRTLEGARLLEMRIGPLALPEQADQIKELFRDIQGLGTISDQPRPNESMRVYRIETTSSDEDLMDLIAFHVAREQVSIIELTEQAGVVMGAPATHDAYGDPVAGTPLPPAPGYGIFADAPGAPPAGAAPGAGTAPAKPAAMAPDAATIRVAISKVDQLINLVGELVITQAMLAQNSAHLDPAANQKLLAGLADLTRNTRDLQESVMSIRMMPMSVVFNRFPRMLRDLAAKLGKKVEFVTDGEATELDKGLVEKITDPLTHLVRNSCDHGIEPPEQRRSAGKAESGTIRLSASHQGGSIVIEVRDDGRGLSRSKILAKARERGMEVANDLSDPEVWQLIFAPGFSTADVVTDVSGRGVGMDVVRRNILDLGGTVELDSAEGHGTRVSVRLPLTLAIMDGMSVGCGEEIYILPLSSVVETFQVRPENVNTLASTGKVVKVREEFLPVVSLQEVFAVPKAAGQPPGDIMVVIEADGLRVCLLVDDLLGQQQVVVKNLETNYRKVPNVAGATILGDGRVALILDTSALARRGHR